MRNISANLNTISNNQLHCGESPLYLHDTNQLYWVDSGSQGLYGYDLSNEKEFKIDTSITITFISRRQKGGLLIGSPSGLYSLSFSDNFITPLDVHSTTPLYNLNDGLVDPAGNLYTGQEAYSDEQPDAKGFLFRIEPNKATVMEEGLSISNGMGFSPDLRTFYLVDTIPRVIYAYAYDVETGNLKNRRVLKQFNQDQGIPDGMTVDQEGFLWVAMWFGSCIHRIDPDGMIVATIELPFAQPTSVTFGGENFNDLFITSAGVHWETPVAPQNHDYSKPRGGSTFRIRMDYQGKEEYQAKI